MKEFVGSITSSFLPISSALKINSRASVPLEQLIEYLEFVNSENKHSNSPISLFRTKRLSSTIFENFFNTFC